MNQNVINQFPSLQRAINGKPICYLDGPAGTQVPISVIEAISDYYKKSNSNTHGFFTSTIETDQMLEETREKIAIFLGAEDASCISLGQNMTSLNYSLSRAIGRFLQEGDEILITQLDHESNRGPWLALEALGIVIKEVRVTSEGTLDYQDFENIINEKTRLVAMGMASNYSGAINDYTFARTISDKYGALLLLDAVHYAPHFKINVQALRCDFLLCSAYKFYGPHVGILYTKKGLLEQLPTDRLRTVDQHPPYIIETGTLNHAAIVGVKASIDFIASLGIAQDLKSALNDAFTKISNHEKALAEKLYTFLNQSDNFQIIGPDFKSTERAPTISFFSKDHTSQELCTLLGKENIYAWDGHFYAIKASEVLGMEEKGGVTRMGISVYTSEEDINKVISFLNNL